MKCCVHTQTKKLTGMQDPSPEAGVLKSRALVEFGYPPDALDEREGVAEYEAALAEDPFYLAEQQAAQDAASFASTKLQEIADNLPSWDAVSNAIDGVTTIAGMRVVVKKLARIVYLLAKNSAT